MKQNRMIKAAAGIAIGVGVGVALSNVALGVGLAVIFGAAMSQINLDNDE